MESVGIAFLRASTFFVVSVISGTACHQIPKNVAVGVRGLTDAALVTQIRCSLLTETNDR